jgi:hypothetical protein
MSPLRLRSRAGRVLAGIALAGTAAVAGILAVPATTAAASTVGPYNIVFGNSGKCLDDPNFATADHTQMDQWTCGAGANEAWYLDYVTTDTFRIRGKSSGKCLNVPNSSYVNGARIVLWECQSATNETFELGDTNIGSPQYEWIEPVGKPSMALNVGSASTANGAAIILYTKSAATNEYARIVGAQPASPTRTNGLNKPVYFVHGYDLGLANPDPINSYWGNTLYDFEYGTGPSGLAAANEQTFCYYTLLSGCSVSVAGDVNVPIKTLAEELAWNIFTRYSRYGQAIDIVAHSMGGLVARGAVTGVQNHDPAFPPYLYVEDAVTVDTPNNGLSVLSATYCFTAAHLSDNQQCSDMLAGSSYLNWVAPAPASTVATDWTYIGSDDDIVISTSTSVPDSFVVEHKVIYNSGQLPTAYAHMDMLSYDTGTWNYRYCDLDAGYNYCQSAADFTAVSGSGYDPVRMVRQSVYDNTYW